MLAGFEYLKGSYGKLTKRFPEASRNVFVMMPFTTYTAEEIYRSVHSAIEDHGLISLRADEYESSSDIWWNVVTYMLASSYGVAIYEPKDGIPFNPNVSIEAGFMLALDRPVLLLANQRLAQLPVNFSGRVYKTFNDEDLGDSTYKAVSDWIERDISYFDYGKKKLVVFVSLGGTCRCVMAKAILSDRLEKSKIALAVEAAAVADPHHNRISVSAVRALSEINADQWITGHRPRKLSKYLQSRADLIIALTDPMLARSYEPGGKIKSDLELFGRVIPNPYPDDENEESLSKYRKVRIELEDAIAACFEKIVELAGARPSIKQV